MAKSDNDAQVNLRVIRAHDWQLCRHRAHAGIGISRGTNATTLASAINCSAWMPTAVGRSFLKIVQQQAQTYELRLRTAHVDGFTQKGLAGL
jgi:hypothetical protein